MKIKIVFFGSSSYPLPILDSLIKDKELKITLVVTRPNRPVGRKKLSTPNPVKVWALKNKIEVITPSALKEKDLTTTVRKLKEKKPDLGLVAHFGLLIPKEIFEYPKHQTINVHFSLLPKYRGAAPIQHAIINGDKETGITILKIAEKFDTGDILYQKKIMLMGNETVNKLYKNLFQKTASFLPEVIMKYIRGEITPIPQNETQATYAPRLKTEDAKIDWSKTQEEIERFIRGVNPEPGAWADVTIKYKTLRLKILEAHLEGGKLILDEVQLEGKNPVSFKQFQEAFPMVKLLNGYFLPTI